MKIKLFQGKALDRFDQITIWDRESQKKMEYLIDFQNYKEAFDWLIQALNDEALDTTNNFHSYGEEK